MRIRTVRMSGAVIVKVLMAHPMETGRAKDADGQLIPAWFIQQVEVWLDQELLLEADWGPAVARNPFLQFALTGPAPAGQLRVRWRDNHGDQQEDTLTLG